MYLFVYTYIHINNIMREAGKHSFIHSFIRSRLHSRARRVSDGSTMHDKQA